MRKLQGGAWFVMAFVALAALVFTGCPHNNLLEVSGGGGESRSGGGGEVKLVITNFVSSVQGATKSAGWLSPARSIAPEHIDLTKDDRVREYVFVATGIGEGGSYGPKFIDIAAGTGRAELPGLDPGRWDITVEAYSVERLTAADRATFPDRDQILQDPTKVTDVVGRKAEALVLSGQASLYLGGSTEQVTLTLAAAKEAEYGEVDVAVYFSTSADVTSIFAADSGYTVKARLVEPANGQTVQGGTGKNEPTEVVLFQETTAAAGAVRVDTDPQGDYTYRAYTNGQGYADKTIAQTVPNQTKLLSYKPTDAQQQADPMKIPVGKYVLLVEVTTPDGNVLYASDSFFVEGNRTTMGVLEIKDLLGTDPEPPEGFEVYYTKPSLTDALVGYDATFVWKPNTTGFSVVSYEMEIADITDVYTNDGAGVSKITVAGQEEEFTGGENLWDQDHLGHATMADRITKINWKNQTVNGTYAWKGGSLLTDGANSLTLRLDSGHVYSARIRASNGTSKSSDWVYFKSITPAAAPVGATKFDHAEASGIFDLVAITYSLQAVDMYTLTQDSADMTARANATLVAPADLLQVYEYDPQNVDEVLAYAFEGATVGAIQGDAVLVAKGDQGKRIVQSWEGWQDKATGSMFGPIEGQNAKADWKYDGFKNLTLVPLGGGGSSVKIEVETADTTNVLTLSTVGFDDAVPGASLASSTVETGLAVYKQGDPAGVYRNTAGTKLVLVLNANSTSAVDRSGATTELYVAVGNSDGAGGVGDTLSDKNGNPITVKNLVVELQGPGNSLAMRTTASFTSAVAAGNPSYAVFKDTSKIGGVKYGNYTLHVVMTTASGYEQTIKIPVTILYQDQTANIPNIP